jgi:hypothetical protein
MRVFRQWLNTAGCSHTGDRRSCSFSRNTFIFKMILWAKAARPFFHPSLGNEPPQNSCRSGRPTNPVAEHRLPGCRNPPEERLFQEVRGFPRGKRVEVARKRWPRSGTRVTFAALSDREISDDQWSRQHLLRVGASRSAQLRHAISHSRARAPSPGLHRSRLSTSNACWRCIAGSRPTTSR